MMALALPARGLGARPKRMGGFAVGWMMDWIAAPFVLAKVKAARALLAAETPMKNDCGMLCGGACCKPDESGENGMLLYPFEERLYRAPIEGFSYVLRADDRLYRGGWRLVCEGECPREHRPLACRMFPLRIRVTEPNDEADSRAVAVLDPRAWAVCPLLEGGGLRAMRASFVTAVAAAGEEMCRSPYLLESLLNEQRLLDTLCRL